MTAGINSLARWAAASAVLTALAAPPASAQTPTPAQSTVTGAQSAFLGAAFATVVNGREVWITTSNGSRLKARVAGVAPAGLTVTPASGQGQTIRYDDITRIQKVSHRLRTGVIVGLSVGAGFGALGAGLCDEGACAAALIGTYAAIGTGIGALAGAIRNSVNRDDDLVYVAGTRTTTLAMTPIVSRTRKGVAFSVSWR